VIVQAKSGSGKTAAFVAPLLSKIDTTLPHTQVSEQVHLCPKETAPVSRASEWRALAVPLSQR
jgi:superfamily II DNA/RNA helicase